MLVSDRETTLPIELAKAIAIEGYEHPEPEIRARRCDPTELPTGAAQLLTKLAQNGWASKATLARGTTLPSWNAASRTYAGKVVTDVQVRARKDDVAIVCSWEDGAVTHGWWLVLGVSLEKVNVTELKRRLDAGS